MAIFQLMVDILNITGDISMNDVYTASNYVHELVGENANIIFGADVNTETADEVTVTVIIMAN